MDVDGWHPDPYGIHEERLFAHGEPTSLVRDGGIGSVDAPSEGEHAVKRMAPEPVDSALSSALFVGGLPSSGYGASSGKRPSKPVVTLATVLIGVGVVFGLLELARGGPSGNAETTTTQNPLHAFAGLPSTTVLPPQGGQGATTTTDLSTLEQALQALPKTPTDPTTAPATTATTAPAISSTTSASAPPKRAAPPATSSVASTTVPPSPTTTAVAQADEAWVVAHVSVFNTLQTDIEKLDRVLASTTPSGYTGLSPYWQELYDDANSAGAVPAIPDSTSQSFWSTGLADLSQGSTLSILGAVGVSPKTGYVPTIFTQGSALITTGTAQLDAAIGSAVAQAAVTSASSRTAVSGWVQSHGAVFTTLQNDVSNLNAAFSSAGSSGSSTVTPYWQQLLSDVQNAMNLTPIPDPLIQSYWATALSDLVQGTNDCLGSSEAAPPSVFDQGVALISSGGSYLNTSQEAVQTLAG